LLVPPPKENANSSTANSLNVSDRQTKLQEELNKKLSELNSSNSAAPTDLSGGVMVALGDASIASPFTSKLPSPAACAEILRQGRCTLVTTHQMYKILAINSLVASYQLSVLYLNGVKSGDTQATIGGMSVASFFMFISWAKPIKKLAPVKPYTSVFNVPLILAIFGQFLIHLTTLIIANQLCVPYAMLDRQTALNATIHNLREAAKPGMLENILGINSDSASSQDSLATSLFDSQASKFPYENKIADTDLDREFVVESTGDVVAVDASESSPTWDEEQGNLPQNKSNGGKEDVEAPKFLDDMHFTPNIINTIMFLLSTSQQTTTFLINYSGHPFMQGLWENVGLIRTAMITFACCLLGASGLSGDLNHWLQLVVLPTFQLKLSIIGLMVVDAIACFAFERTVRYIWGVGVKST
jgi:magnesium-transporting ATPase (P-type)